MSRIIVPQRRIWTRQPQQAVEIDWSNPITTGIAFAAYPAAGDVISMAQPVLSGSSTIGINAAGRSYKSPSTQIPGAWTFSVNIPSSFDITVICLFRDIMEATATPSVPTLEFNSAEVVKFSSTGTQSVFSSTGNASTTITNLTAGTIYSLAGVKRINSQEQYVNGELRTTNVTGNRAVGEITSVSVGRPGGANNIENCEYIAVFYFRRALSPTEIRLISANPWQIFTRRDRRTIIDFGASGTTPVYADSALTYYIRSMLSSDSGVQYAIRNAIYQDDAVGYYLRASISQNNEVSYILRSAIAKDDAEAYKIRGLIQSDDVEAYNVRGLVQTSGNETYSIRGAVQTDVTTNYDIQSSTSVASTNTVSYSVRGSVSGDVSPSYAVRGVAQSDVSAGYSVRASAYRDVAASYTIEVAASSVYADLTASYSIDGVAPSVDYDQIAAAVVAAMQTSPTPFPSNVTHFNGNPTVGSGTPADPVRPA